MRGYTEYCRSAKSALELVLHNMDVLEKRRQAKSIMKQVVSICEHREVLERHTVRRVLSCWGSNIHHQTYRHRVGMCRSVCMKRQSHEYSLMLVVFH